MCPRALCAYTRARNELNNTISPFCHLFLAEQMHHEENLQLPHQLAVTIHNGGAFGKPV
jgi:hypothetical protein